MQKQTGFIIAIIAVAILLVGAILLSGDSDQTNQITPTPVVTRANEPTPEPSVTQEPDATPTGDELGEENITLDEIALHSVADDCWMAIENNVYDVTDFVKQHPGGQAILMGCGTDATELFNDRPNNKGEHSNVARTLLPQYLIGTLAE